MVALFRDRALQWAQARYDLDSLGSCSYDQFIDRFKQTFCLTRSEEQTAKLLWELKQGNRSVADLAVEFRTLAAESGWNRPALKAAFLQSLNERIKDELAYRDEPESEDDLIDLAIKIDNRLRERARTRSKPQSVYAPPLAASSALPTPTAQPPRQPSPEPMQIGRARLSPAERQRRMEGRCCLYCGAPGHFISNCPARPKDPVRQ